MIAHDNLTAVRDRRGGFDGGGLLTTTGLRSMPEAAASRWSDLP